MESAGKSKLDAEVFVRAMHEKMEGKLRAVAAAVNAAPDGAWINGSEMEVRDLFAQMRQEAYEKAVQMRMDAAQGAFSPGGPGDRAASGQQGSGKPKHVDGQRAN